MSAIRYLRADVHSTNGESYLSVIFAFNNGKAAIWKRNSKLSATVIRPAAPAVFVKGKPTPLQNVVHLDGEDWTVRNLGGLACCGAGSAFSFAKLLNPELTSIG